MAYLGKHIHTITREDVGQSTIRLAPCSCCGRVRSISLMGAIGGAQTRDVGKQVWEHNGVIQVENDEQRAKREAK